LELIIDMMDFKLENTIKQTKKVPLSAWRKTIKPENTGWQVFALRGANQTSKLNITTIREKCNKF
jgi:hypothetical protein